MNTEQPAVSYEQFFRTPVERRTKMFSEISAHNRAFLIKTHAERWLAANRHRLTGEQVAAVEELILSVSPEWYKTNRHFEEIDPEVEKLVRKIEAVLPREDTRQLAANRADYIPVVEDTNG